MGKKNRTKQTKTIIKSNVKSLEYLTLLHDLSVCVTDEFQKNSCQTHIKEMLEVEQYFAGFFSKYMGGSRNNLYYTVISRGKLQVYDLDHEDLTKQDVLNIKRILDVFAKKHGLEIINEN